jgi:hypothetical protein
LGGVEATIAFKDANVDSTKAKEVSVKVGGTNSDTFWAAAKSDAGKCWYIKDTASGSTYADGAGDACSADDASAAGVVYDDAW